MTRRYFLYPALILIVGLIAGSCKKKGPTETDNDGKAPGACGINSSLDTMSARINNTDWSAIIVIGTKIGDFVNIVGNDGCDPSRVITFNLTAEGPGSYKIPETEKEREKDTALVTVVYSVGTTGFWDAQSPIGKGTVTFSRLDAVGATGTFFFTLQPLQGTNSTGSPSITSGQFNLKFSAVPTGAAP